MNNAYRPRRLADFARPRRTCLSVPGSSAKMIEKSKGLPADEVFLDLEDAVAPDAKAEARTQVAVALAEPGWSDQLRGVRVNDWTTPWTYADVIEVVSTAGASLDLVVLPKVTDVSHIHALDLLLSQLETTHGLPVGRIGIEAQIENAQGLTNVDAIAAGPRVQALVLGPADMMASLNMRTLVVGEQPEGYDVGDAYHHALMTILVAARTHGVAAIDGPYLKVRDVDAFRRVAGRSAALGYDGKWVLHPDQIAAGNEIFSPRQEAYDHAELILEAYDWHTSRAGGARGAVMLGDEMIDEASRKMAMVIAGKGRAAGMIRKAEPFLPPIVKPTHAGRDEPAAPLADGIDMHTHLGGDLGIGGAVGRSEHDPRADHVAMRRRRRPGSGTQNRLVQRTQGDDERTFHGHPSVVPAPGLIAAATRRGHPHRTRGVGPR